MNGFESIGKITLEKIPEKLNVMKFTTEQEKKTCE